MSSLSLIISNDQSTIGIPPLTTKPPVFVVIYMQSGEKFYLHYYCEYQQRDEAVNIN